MNLDKIEKIIPKERIHINAPMAKYTSFKIGGNAELLININTVEELQETLRILNEDNTKKFILGNGSNILVSDEGIKGVVLKIDIKKFEITEDKQKYTITLGAGCKLGETAYKLANKEIAGLEFASGIPGTIGGAIRMNAGAYGTEMKDIIKTITYVDRNGNIHKIKNQEAQFEYRNSIFCRNDDIIVECEIELNKGNKEEIQSKMQEYAKSRREKQPIEYPSAGSTFKRGKNFITAKLIDECGLKGYQIGDAQVSEKHAGFIINKGNATSKEVEELIEYVKKQVFENFGEKIETEIEIIH